MEELEDGQTERRQGNRHTEKNKTHSDRQVDIVTNALMDREKDK